MIVNIIILSALLSILMLNNMIVSRWNKITPVFGASISFCFISIFVVLLMNWSLDLISIEDTSIPIYPDSLIYFNSILIKIRNLSIIVALFYLSFGLYKQYSVSRVIVFKVLSVVLMLLSIIFLVLSIYSNAFTI